MGRNNKRIENEFDFDMEMPKKKGTSYQRKQLDREKQNKEKKHSKRLNAYSDSERARSAEAIRNYLNGTYNEDDDDFF